ncbi:MAG: glycerophosphodiester phosphodiesterase [Planctomycetota bacterium]
MTNGPVLAHLRQLAAREGPIVVAHRGDSRNHPENTLAAFAAAAALPTPVQEFDVQVAGDGTLVCMHDHTVDRTTDAATVLGPGMLVASLEARHLRALDAGVWKGAAHRGQRIPSLQQALEVQLPASVPMIEHKGGEARVFVDELRRLDCLERVLLQSFDWDFVAAAAKLAPTLATGLLGPTPEHSLVDDGVTAAARAIGAGFVHWHAPLLSRDQIERAHRHDLLVCTYTSDDELSWQGGRALGVDAMCTNDPARMLRALRR